ncbi:MAG: hypothetical protein PHQ58_03060 [Rhodoferax sp.]|nr:hypothetical protein [Rhodoferax sp.]MDD2879392.1 hypothetical protein [Rhodoferax sp.]
MAQEVGARLGQRQILL